jgi:PleD family two-component response regulator
MDYDSSVFITSMKIAVNQMKAFRSGGNDYLIEPQDTKLNVHCEL